MKLQLISLSASLLLSGCASLQMPAVDVLPELAQEDARRKDPRKQELYDQYHLPKSRKPRISTSIKTVNDQRKQLSGVEGWVYISGTW